MLPRSHGEWPEIRTEYLLLISCFRASFELQVCYQSLICTAKWWRHSLKGICLVEAAKINAS